MRRYMNGIMGLLLAVSAPVMADDDYSAVEGRIRALAPNASSIAISETPIEGVLMVQVSGDIVYATADGKYLIQGRVIDMETREDLTEGAKSEIRQEIMADMDKSTQIVFAPEEPAYELTVFTDIDCGYCRKLHNEMPQFLDAGIRVRYMFYPRAGVGSDSYKKAVSVWCADDRQGALTAAKNNRPVENKTCDNPIEEHMALVEKLGARGTPFIVLEDGQVQPGYVPAATMAKLLDGASMN